VAPPARVGKAHRNHRMDPRAAAVNARGDAAPDTGGVACRLHRRSHAL
jgi:hypothetical protein